MDVHVALGEPVRLEPERGGVPAHPGDAACADSRMTSPIWPVTVSLPLPGIAVASTKSTSPPTGVTARPVATPGSDVRLRASAEKRRLPSQAHARLVDPGALALALGDLARGRAERRDLAVEVRTPASRVYSRTSSRSAFSVKVTRLPSEPCASSCLGTRRAQAIPTFSSSV